MFKTVVGFLSGHAAQAVGAASGLMLAGMVGYVAFSGSFSTDFFDEMAWQQGIYENNQAFGAVSYQVGEVDESDNRIHEDEGEDEGVSDEPTSAPEAGATDPDQAAAVIGDAVTTDTSTLVGDDTVVVADPSNSDAPVIPSVPGSASSGGDEPGSGEGEGPGGESPGGETPGGDAPGGESPNPGGEEGNTPPPPSEEQQEQLTPYPPHVNEDGNTLEYIKADVPADWTFAQGDSYSPDGVTVWATYRKPDGSLMDPVKVPYGGDDGYEAYLSKAWGSGTHEATFVYKGESDYATYTVMGKRYDVKYGSWNSGWYPAAFPNDCNCLGNESLEKTAKRIQDEAIPESLVGGFFTDCSDALRFMVTVLGREDCSKRFKACATHSAVTFLHPFATSYVSDLDKMAKGFATVSGGEIKEGPFIYMPSEVGGLSAKESAVLIVEDVPTGFHVQRWANGNLSDQVLVGYKGTEAEIEVPLGVTRVKLAERNESVKKLVLSEGVLDIDFASLSENFPNLEHIQVGKDGEVYNNSQTFSSHDGVLYSADASRVLYVPPNHAEVDSLSWYARVITQSAFESCKIAHVTIPTQIIELEGGCFAGINKDKEEVTKLEFASETPVDGMAQSGFEGTFYVPGTPYDTACKQWTAAVGSSSGMYVGVLDGEGAVVTPGTTYRYDAERDVVVLATESPAVVLAGVPASAPKAYLVPDGITAIGAGAFAATDGLREVVIPESVRELRADSLVGLGDGVRVTLSGTEAVTIDSAAFGSAGGSGSGSGASVPDMTVFVPGELLESYRASWGSALGEDVAQKLLKPIDATYLYLDNAKYLPLDENDTQLRLVEVFDEGQTFFEPDARTTEIAEGAFSGCASLEIVHIPASVASVGESVFEGCANLESVVVSGKLPALPDTGAAQLLQPGDGVTYDYEPDTGAVYRTDENGELTLVNVPTDTKAITVRANTAHLGDAAFAGCTHFNPNSYSVTLATPETLRSIGAHCFEGGAGLGEASLADTAVESIGERAFADHANLERVQLPAATKTVGEGAFSGCSELMYVTAEGISELAPRTFANCTSLQSIKASNVSVVGDESFYGCEQLVSIASGIDVDKITWVGDRAFAYCVSFAQNASTQELNMKSLTHIGAQAFRDCHTLRTVVLPETLTEMGEEAFRDCTALFTLNAESSLSIIGRYSFYGCTNLSNVNLGDRQKQALTTVGACAFASCNVIERLDLSDCTNLTYLGDRAFEGCARLLRVTLPASLAKVSDRCFENCPNFSIMELTAAKPTELGSSMFGATPPEYVRIWVPDEQAYATYLDAYEQKLDPEYGDGYALSVLEVHSDTSETLRGITYTATGDGHWIVTDAMESLSGDILLTSDVVKVAPEAFKGCDKLKSVQCELGASIALGDRAFAGCKSLESVTLNGGIPEWGVSVFEGCPNLKSAYLGHSSTKLTISRIGPRAFADCPSLSSLTFTLPMNEIGDEAFINCTSLTTIASTATARKAIQRYGDRAFMNCTSLSAGPLATSYTGLQSIGERAFANCDSMVNGYIPKNVKTLGEACFAECDKLKTVSIYGGLAVIPKDCFKNCVSLTRTAGKNYGALTHIGAGAYAGCTSLKAADNWSPGKYTALESIGAGAFAGAFKHAEAPYSFTLASSLTDVGANAFDGCVGLSSIELQSAPTLGANAFANMAEGFKLKVPDGTYDAYLPVLSASIGEEAARGMLFDEAAAAVAAASEAERVASEAAGDVAAASASDAANADDAAAAVNAPSVSHTDGASSAADATASSAAGAASATAEDAVGSAGGGAETGSAGPGSAEPATSSEPGAAEPEASPAATDGASESGSARESQDAAAARDAGQAQDASAASGAASRSGSPESGLDAAAASPIPAASPAGASSSATRSTEPTEGETA
ncbi:leucine-rich repeat domain-containing protein [Adlercreutzia sp. ZJ242]|uniref:leucine-rich repeat domain-containing protein n=1 Tax=Adlercreutzia sp. ZJ242 TaxID=2709409 RepID=UPI0013EAA19C|nr:leucine-rich repeat domain-containing protein [Adlercreutzia sp. ZJ242]